MKYFFFTQRSSKWPTKGCERHFSKFSFDEETVFFFFSRLVVFFENLPTDREGSQKEASIVVVFPAMIVPQTSDGLQEGLHPNCYPVEDEGKTAETRWKQGIPVTNR